MNYNKWLNNVTRLFIPRKTKLENKRFDMAERTTSFPKTYFQNLAYKAISSFLNNTRVAHIEGGEVSGTKDELIRHSISKLANFHFVSNDKSKKRLVNIIV